MEEPMHFEEPIKARVSGLSPHGIAAQIAPLNTFLAIPGWSCEI
jgi:hypothetical protein